MALEIRPLAITADSIPFGTSSLPSGEGVDLAPYGYIEEEFLVSGAAAEWRYDDALVPRRWAVHPYTTRVLIRRPADPSRASGAVQLEPLHPNLERANTWRPTHPWIMRNGHTWVGVTQVAHNADWLRERFDPQRYAAMDVPAEGLGYDILGQVAVGLRTGELPVGEVTRLVMSGWSATGSFCRVFSQDGFHELYRLPDGRPAVDGYIIGISSGAAGLAGYPPLSAESRLLPAADPRRIVSGHGVPIFEVLSEFESETHRNSIRPDSDSPEDPYRLYQIAGTSHAPNSDAALTSHVQWEAAGGGQVSERRILEEPSDAEMDFVARALYQRLDDWIAHGTVPPTADRFAFAEGIPSSDEVLGDSLPLGRDAHGNVLGGIRTPWVEAPRAAYRPHSTPAPGYCLPPGNRNGATPESFARLIGHMVPFDHETLAALYASEDEYIARYAAAVERAVEDGYLLRQEADRLLDAYRAKVAR